MKHEIKLYSQQIKQKSVYNNYRNKLLENISEVSQTESIDNG